MLDSNIINSLRNTYHSSSFTNFSPITRPRDINSIHLPKFYNYRPGNHPVHHLFAPLEKTQAQTKRARANYWPNDPRKKVRICGRKRPQKRPWIPSLYIYIYTLSVEYILFPPRRGFSPSRRARKKRNERGGGGGGNGISKAHVRINQHLHCNTRLVIGMIAVGVANP